MPGWTPGARLLDVRSRDAQLDTERLAMSDETDELGPVDYLIVEFPGSRMTGEGLPILIDLVDRGIIRILDLVFARKARNGSLTVLTVEDLGGDGNLDLAIFEGASSGLLEMDDIEEAGGVLTAGSTAAILVYENLWAVPMISALKRADAQLVASGRIAVADLESAVDAADGTTDRVP
jgi:hypothetical protein